MSPSSVTPSLPGPRELMRLVGSAPVDWARIGTSVRGPLLTLAAAVLLDVLRRQDVGLISPFPVLLLTIVYSAYVGGLGSALVSVTITILDALHFFAQSGLPLRYSSGNAASLVVVACSALLAGIVVGRLHDRLRRAEASELTKVEVEGLARRFAVLEQASLILSSPRSFETMFRDLARLLAPTLADWCAIHLASDDGTRRFVASAHRDPSRDIVVGARRP
jgi:K+-sensing histidine kinase KdpD